MILTLKAAGLEDLRKFRWLEAPAEAALQHAEDLLIDLGAMVRHGERSVITELGRRMLAFPVHPRYARMLVAAQEYECVYQACVIAALTQGRDLVVRNASPDVRSARADLFGEKAASDFWTMMRAYDFAVENQFRADILRTAGINAPAARQVGPLAEQFLQIARDQGLDCEPREVSETAIRKCILIGFILAPSMRPVQVTRDLANFWREHYPRVKSELQRNIRSTMENPES